MNLTYDSIGWKKGLDGDMFHKRISSQVTNIDDTLEVVLHVPEDVEYTYAFTSLGFVSSTVSTAQEVIDPSWTGGTVNTLHATRVRDGEINSLEVIKDPDTLTGTDEDEAPVGGGTNPNRVGGTANMGIVILDAGESIAFRFTSTTADDNLISLNIIGFRFKD